MQFQLIQKVGVNFCEVTVDFSKFNDATKSSIENSFKRIGGKFENNVWAFPKFVTAEVIEQIIHNTCYVCGGQMQDGEALNNTLVSFNDFGGDAGQRGTTQSRQGRAKKFTVRKCVECGHSHT